MFSIIYYYLKHNTLLSLFYGVCAQFARALAHQSWTCAKRYEHLDVQEGIHNDHKATFSAVFTLVYALISLLCSLSSMSGQDSAGRNRDIHAAAQCTVVV